MYHTVPTSIKDISVKISRIKKDDRIVIIGKPVDSKTGNLVFDLKRGKTIIPGMDDFTERAIVTTIEEECRNILDKPKAYKSNEKTEGTFKKALNNFRKKYNGNLDVLAKDDWNHDTFAATLSYFENQVVPLLDVYGLSICDDDIVELQNKRIQNALENGHSKKDPNTARNSVRGYLRRCNFIYHKLREYYDEFELPDIDLTIPSQGNYVQLEQCKSLPNEVRIKFSALLFRLVKTQFGGFIMGLALMLYAALRTSEAAGTYYWQIKYDNDLATLFVRQQEKNGELILLLKSENAYRDVVLPQIMIDLLKQRIQYLHGLGYTDEQIGNMPLVCSTDNPAIRARSSALSAFGKKMLLLAGLKPNLIRAVENLMYIEPDEVDGERVMDVTAYSLRRDWCTRAFSYCGMYGDMVDYLLGHKRKGKVSRDFKKPEMQQDIFQRLERYVFDPVHTCNPAFLPIRLEKGFDKLLPANQTTNFIVADSEELVEVVLDVECSEPNEEIIFVISPNTRHKIERHDIFDTPAKRSKRPIIGHVFSAEYYSGLINEAQGINLAELEGA